MRNKLMKVLAGSLVVTMTVGLLAGCGSKADSETEQDQNSDVQEETEAKTNVDESETNDEQTVSSDVVLEVETTYSGDQLEGLREIVAGFTEETGINVELVAPGEDYESVLKTRMASGDMPDIFETHGWALARYKEYLTALNDEEWADRVDDAILEVISDENGNFYSLPITQDANGIIYNKKVLEEAGVKAEEILTMDDFMEACEKIKAIGVAPIHVGGKDIGQFAGIYNGLAPAYFCTEGCAYPLGDFLQDGTFDWDAYGNYVIEEIADMIQKGYFNEDYLTADDNISLDALGAGEAAFEIRGAGSILKVKNLHPESEIGFIPVPATGDGELSVQLGEGTGFGIWKDTEYMDEAKMFLNYLARSEVAIAIMELDGRMPVLEGMEDGATVTYEEYKNGVALFDGSSICYDNIFDREYLPSGMWGILMDAMAEVFTNPTEDGIEAARVLLKDNYIEKFEAAQ